MTLGLIASMVLLGNSGRLFAQLAITEVMADASTNHAGASVLRGPDFWELTNFGDEPIDLTGYWFRDDNPARPRNTSTFAGFTLGPQESVVIFRSKDNEPYTATQFREWWWGTPDPSVCAVLSYSGFGLNSDDDELWLFNPAGELVDYVAIGDSQMGRTFVYDPDTGEFGMRSVLGQGCTFKAAGSDDYGSPGCTTGPVRLSIVEHPQGQEVDAGMDVLFTVRASGLPRPRFEWRFMGVPLPAGGTAASLLLSNVQPSDAGEYTVLLDNGSVQMTSDTAVLSVNTQPLAPQITQPPMDLTAYPPQTATFTVSARGYPAPSYQWQADGVDLAGETNRTLTVFDVTLEMSGTEYRVRAWNDHGEASALAQLTVIPRPHLAVTEIMTLPMSAAFTQHEDWFELTNMGTDPLDLQGYRFRDSTARESAWVISDAIMIAPGESIVLVEAMSAEEFVRWWGEECLPPDLQVITFTGFGLTDSGEELYVWNAAATSDLDVVASTSSLMPLEGVSLECVPWSPDCSYGCDSSCNIDSVVGEGGAFRAVTSGDIGSPGYTSNPPPRFTTVENSDEGCRLRWRAIEGHTYSVLAGASLQGSGWVLLSTVQAESSLAEYLDQNALDSAPRFYRLEESAD